MGDRIADANVRGGLSRVMGAGQFCAVSDELVRLTLGGRGPERPELRTDPVGEAQFRLVSRLAGLRVGLSR